MRKDLIFYSWIFIWAAISIFILFATHVIGDNADGVMHYMFARYTHLHPDNFLDPWAKTAYTLVAWPFAQFGLKGVMFLNILCAGGSLWLVYQISKILQLKYAFTSFIMLSLSTYYFTLMYSGLTEHVFSFVLTLSVFLLLKNKWIWGSLILSTLPFFRQEGYIIIFSLLPYYFYQRKIKLIPLLSVSFFLIGAIGAIRYADLFWIIRSNPYKYNMSYGSGKWYSFFVHLYYNNGLINLLFFIVGVMSLLFYFLKNRTPTILSLFLLVFLPFLAFFTAHAVFWYFGIFHSMGLQRVLNCVTPLFVVMGALGFSTVAGTIKSKKVQQGLMGILMALLLIYPFTPSPSNINFKKDFTLKPLDLKIKEATGFVSSTFPNSHIYAEHPLIPFYMDLDPFDKKKFERIFLLDFTKLQPGSVLIWESSFANIQGGLSEEFANNGQFLVKVKEWYTPDMKNKVIVFKKIP